MSSNLDEQVKRLCREIPEEKDSARMMKLVQQLNQLLDEKESATTRPHIIADNAQPGTTESTPAQRERQSA